MKPNLFPILSNCLLALFFTACEKPSSPYNILDFGARGDGKTLNTIAINKSIRKCSDNGGGTIIIPHGTFVSGTIQLLSNVDLHLEPGSTILGSKDTSDYLPMKDTLFNEGYNRFGLIYAVDAKNISITGQGEINGNGTYFMNSIDKPHVGHDFESKFTRQGEAFMKPGTVFEDGPVSYPFRPGLMIIIIRCENVHLSDILLKDAPEWTIRIGDCDNVNIRGISILNNPLIPNNDGIHCTTSRNVCISDCNIFAGDDAIIVSGFGRDYAAINPADSSKKIEATGNRTGIAENVTVTNCILSSRSACIRVGYGEHPIRNLVFSNLVMYASNRGIGVFSRDNSSIQNVLFSNIIIHTRLHSGHWWGKGEPVHISAIKDNSKGNAGKISNIRFTNLVATGENGILIYGTKESVIDNIMLDKVQLTINAGKYTNSYGGNFDLRPAYPLDLALFKHDIPGLYAQYVKNLKVSNFELNWGSALPTFFTNGIEISNFEDITIESFTGNPASNAKGLAAIKITDGAKAELRNNKSTNGSLPLIKEKVK